MGRQVTVQPTRDQLRANAPEGGPWGAVVLALLDQLDQAEADRDWNLRSSRIAKKERIEANARAERAEARVKAVRDLCDDADKRHASVLIVTKVRRALDT